MSVFSAITTPEEVESLEVSLLLEAIFKHYGYDFRNYARTSLTRRIYNCMHREKKSSISELIPEILHDPFFFDRFLQDMSITVTSMFRDPNCFSTLHNDVLPKLTTYPTINIWHAGCASGEEVYALAILLKELGVLSRCRIYATDFNNNSLSIAQSGNYSIKKMDEYANNYKKCGGQYELKDYYSINNETITFLPELKERIVFAHHNLMKDGSFAQMHLILCRNVLIYFDKTMQNKVLSLFSESMIHRGFLMLGNKESIDFSIVDTSFETFDKNARIYRKLLQH